ncbi:sigma factor-like helix-turn-helix DNA-binding protein [Enterococcus casseliflavus]|uniref:sigma factor-like helix-turn-helix DNA-binding protein n=1 Tax=Enterococcus casseliflavus TaxID=37734 RepID=UPI0035DE12DF
MTPKEYLKQAYRIDKRIDKEVLRLKELRELAGCAQAVSYDEKIGSPNQNTEAPFVKVLEKVYLLENHINQQIDKFVDLKRQMSDAIDALPNPDQNLVLSYRYVHGWTWEQIAEELNADRSTVLRWHAKALKLFEVPENPITI